MAGVSNHRLAEHDQADLVPSHVVPIALPLPLKDLRVVNVYAIVGHDGVTLVDSGWADEASEAVIVDGLSRIGFTPRDVRRILVTHAHWDHYSRAISWQRRYGTSVLIGKEERHTIEAFDEVDGAYPMQARLLVKAGAPDLAKIISDLELEPFERDVPFGPPDVWVSDGDQIDCGGTTLAARATPGHTRGHVVYEDRQASLAFTGDHILPRITPSIALERQPEKLPLRSYLASLKLFLDIPDAAMLPAHGAVTASVKERAEQLLEHHRERLDRIQELVAAGSVTAFEVARQMSWTRHDRTIDELGPVHGMTAILEVAAHLDLLEYRGALHRDDSESAQRYAVA
jgi:glyoxylase-like metal-dependent hydrolase (beta-lactamase superfamily II)